MRVLFTGMTLCALTGGAYAGERAVQLINSFQVMCLLEPLNFARSEQKATVMHLPVRQDLRSPPDASGYFSHAKSWLLPLGSGPHEFTVAEAHGPNLRNNGPRCRRGRLQGRTDQIDEAWEAGSPDNVKRWPVPQYGLGYRRPLPHAV
jgi:hypothetical protein